MYELRFTNEYENYENYVNYEKYKNYENNLKVYHRFVL